MLKYLDDELKEILSTILAVVLLVASVCGVLVGIPYLLSDSGEERDRVRREHRLKIEEEGSAACRAGIPANANPYQGSTQARIWLDGYIKAKTYSDPKPGKTK